MNLHAEYLYQFTYCPYKHTKARPRKARSEEGALFIQDFKTLLGETQPFFADQGGFCKAREAEEHYVERGR